IDKVNAGTRCRFGATQLVGELPRSNGQTTAWPAAPSRVRVIDKVNAGTRCRFGATQLVGELPRSNGQTTAWPAAPSRVRGIDKENAGPDAVLARPSSLASYPVATGRPRPGQQRPRARVRLIEEQIAGPPRLFWRDPSRWRATP